jgi:hypothetical protein
MGSIKFTKAQNRLKRALPGFDHYSGLAFYTGSMPSGFSVNDRIKEIPDLAGAEALGIDDLCSDETKATGTLTVTAVGADGDTVKMKVTEKNGTVVDLGTYTKLLADNSVTLVAVGMKTIINAGTATHGYTAANLAGVLTITARPKAGASLNTGTPLAVVITGTVAITVVQFAGGVMSVIKVLHYHISEFFRINPDGVFFVGIFAVPGGAHTFSELGDLRTYANGRLRQIGAWTTKAYTAGDIALLQHIYDDSFDIYAMHEILYSANLRGVTDANLPDVSAKASPNVHLIIGQDGAADGNTMYLENALYSIGCIGAALGATSLAKVHENIGWVQKFDMSQAGGELDVPALVNGSLFSALSTSYTKDQGTFDTKRLMFLKKYPGATGSFFNDTHGAVAANSDYAYMEDNRTIDKAIRGVYTDLLPQVNGPVLLDETSGKLSAQYCTHLQLVASRTIEQMEKDGEVSGFVVTIDPNQDVNATGKIKVNITNTKIGVSRTFDVVIGY